MLLCKNNHASFKIIIKSIFVQQERNTATATAATKAITTATKEKRKPWTVEESKKIIELVQIHGTKWKKIQEHFPDRGSKSIGGRYHHIMQKSSGGDLESLLMDDTEFRRNVPWTKKEDALLLEKAELYGCKWTQITKYFENRGVPHLRQRYARLLDSPLVHRGFWSKKETKQLEDLLSIYGQDFKKIADIIGTRNPEQCRARFKYLSVRPPTAAGLNKEQVDRLRGAFEEIGSENIRVVLRKAQLPIGLQKEDVRQFYWRELEPNIVRSEWTEQEVINMAQLHDELDGCMELVQSRLPIKRGLKDMWIHYHDYILDKKNK